jgi:hypothetical protein
MARSGLQLSESDIKNIFISGIVVGSAFAAFKQVTNIQTILFLAFFGLITVSSREIGQRMVGQWMDAQVDTELSKNGAITTLVIAMFSYLSSLNLAFIVPIFSDFSGESFEHWGKSIDAIWAKRKYWMTASGILTLLLSWAISYTAGLTMLAEMISLFTFFQLLPLDSHKQVSGMLDGAHIIMWSGFMWLIFTGLTIIAMILTIL